MLSEREILSSFFYETSSLFDEIKIDRQRDNQKIFEINDDWPLLHNVIIKAWRPSNQT